jgi:DNA-binding CsgD family transcriptional regulator
MDFALNGQPGEVAVDPLAARLALSWLDGDAIARLICTQDGALLWTNAAGQDALVRGGALELRDGLLQAGERGGQYLFARFVAELGPLPGSVALPFPDGDGHLLLRGRQIGGDSASRYLGITFHSTGSGFRALYADLEKVYQLTPAEYRVLGEMIDGRTADAIARLMKLSIETVRSHIRHIYSKMRVSSREELFSKISPFRL